MDPDLGTERLRVVRDGAVAWIVFDHPERHNALTGDMTAALGRAAAALGADPGVRVVVLRGAGDRAFVSGGDVGGVRGAGGPPDPATMFAGMGCAALMAVPQPVVAMIHGWCLGGGLLVALCADLRVASDDATFGIPAARLGVGYPHEGVEALVAAVGSAHAAEILLTGDRYPAADAHRMGLVQRVVPKRELEPATRALVDRLLANAPLSMRAAKAAIHVATSADRDDRVRAVDRLIAAAWASEDLAEGQQAFLAKRPPVFRGR